MLLARVPAGILRVLAEGERLKLGVMVICTILLAQPVTVGNKDAAKNITSNWKRSDFRIRFIFVC